MRIVAAIALFCVIHSASIASADSVNDMAMACGLPQSCTSEINSTATNPEATSITFSNSNGVEGVITESELTIGDSPDTQFALDGQFIARREGNAKVRIQSFGTSPSGYVAFDRASGTVASPTAVGANKQFGSVVGVGNDGTDFADHGPEIVLLSTEQWTDTAHGSSVKILGVLNGTTTQVPLIWAGLSGTGHVYIPSGDLILNTTGTTIAVDSGTAASACKGSGTFNGTTAVVISTTCASTSNMVMITPTSDPTGATAAYCWHSATSNGVSFTVDCDQANDGTFNWLIVKEG